MKTEIRKQYDKLVAEMNAIYEQKSNCKSNIGRNSFDSKVLTPVQVMTRAAIKRNEIRKLLTDYRQQKRG